MTDCSFNEILRQTPNFVMVVGNNVAGNIFGPTVLFKQSVFATNRVFLCLIHSLGILYTF